MRVTLANEPMRLKKPSKRAIAMGVYCPSCGAVPKRPCVGSRGNIRTAIHADRYALARGERPA